MLRKVFTECNSLKWDILFNPIFIPCFSGSRFFRVRVQGLGPGCRSSSIKKLLKKCKMAVVKVWQKHFFMYKFVSLLTRVITVHKKSKIHFVNKRYTTINAIYNFCNRSLKVNWHLFIMTSCHSKRYAAVKKCIEAKEQKVSLFSFNHKDFIVVQTVYDFFLHKIHIGMNVYEKLFL